MSLSFYQNIWGDDVLSSSPLGVGAKGTGLFCCIWSRA